MSVVSYGGFCCVLSLRDGCCHRHILTGLRWPRFHLKCQLWHLSTELTVLDAREQVATCGVIFGIRQVTGNPHQSLPLKLSSAFSRFWGVSPHFWLSQFCYFYPDSLNSSCRLTQILIFFHHFLAYTVSSCFCELFSCFQAPWQRESCSKAGRAELDHHHWMLWYNY